MGPRTRDSNQHIHNITLQLNFHIIGPPLYTPSENHKVSSNVDHYFPVPNLQVVKKKKAMSTHNVLRNLHIWCYSIMSFFNSPS